jgi:hypothetical protein
MRDYWVTVFGGPRQMISETSTPDIWRVLAAARAGHADNSGGQATTADFVARLEIELVARALDEADDGSPRQLQLPL